MVEETGDIFRSEDINDVYKFDKRLGSGSFGDVRKAIKLSTCEPFAIKIIDKNNMEADDIVALQTEIEILSQIDHPNIVKMFELYEDVRNFYIVFEIMYGGELSERVIEKDHYSEKEAAETLSPIVDAIRYCHSMGIAHRDLKPENLLYATSSPNSLIKITDFGLAKVLDETNKMQTYCGTPIYVAPEVLTNKGQGYDVAVDYWSVGVILYVMLYGFPPFYHEDDKVLFEMITKANFTFPVQEDDVSDSAKDLIKKLLVLDPKKRLNADQILEHPWIIDKTTKVKNLTNTTAGMREYNTKKKLRRVGIVVLASTKMLRAIRLNDTKQ